MTWPEAGRSVPPGAGLTRRAITAITLTISGLCFAFCFGNAHQLCIALGIEGWIAWLIGPSVDLSVIGLLLGVRHLSSLGYTDAQLAKPRRLLTLCGLLTLALNTADSITHGQYGTAAVEAIGPVLLVCWADVGPWLLGQIHTSPLQDQADPDPVPHREPAPQDGPQPPRPGDLDPESAFRAGAPRESDHAQTLVGQPGPFERPERPEELVTDGAARQSGGSRDEDELWAGALRLDAEHRAEHGRAISRDALRDGLRVGTNKASDLTRRLRAHTAHAARQAVEDDPVPTGTPQDGQAVLVLVGADA